jgi:hypothetical protein
MQYKTFFYFLYLITSITGLLHAQAPNIFKDPIPHPPVPAPGPGTANQTIPVPDKHCCPQPPPLCCAPVQERLLRPCITCRPRRVCCPKPVRCVIRTCRLGCPVACMPQPACCRPRICRRKVLCCPAPLPCRPKPLCCQKIRCCRPKPKCCPPPIPVCPPHPCIVRPQCPLLPPPQCPCTYEGKPLIQPKAPEPAPAPTMADIPTSPTSRIRPAAGSPAPQHLASV